MDNGEDPEEALCDDEKDSSTGSGTASLGSSFSSSQDLRRMMRPPNKKKYEEEMEEIQKQIRAKDAEMKALGNSNPEVNAHQLREIRAEKEASISKRKKIDNDLRLLNQEITKKMGVLSRTESNLHYKNEAKIDDAIRKMQWQLETQNFRVAEERRIVAEIDKLRRSKKLLVEYMAQKNEVDKMRESQRRMRGERELYYRSVTNLSKREEELKRSTGQTKQKAEEIKKELDELYAKKKDLFSNFKQSESDYTRHMHERRHRLRKESFKKKEAEKKAREENWQKEMFEYESQREPFEDEKNLCNTLISYLQKWTNPDREEAMLPSPREEQPPQPVGAGLADSLDGGKFVLLKKSEEVEEEYSLANKPRRRSKKGRKLSVTKPLAHTPQIIAQFASLNLYAPSNVSEVAASVEQLQARKRYYEEQAGMVHKPLIGNLSGSFSSSGSMSGSLDSPLRERSSTWGYVEVPPAIAESQTPSDAGNSAESGFHDMSRQASKTESSKSADECTQNDQALDEIIQQCECAASETSRSSSDTITPEDQICDDGDQSKAAGSSESGSSSQDTSQGNKGSVSDNQSVLSHDNDSAESLVFEESGSKVNFKTGELLRGSNSEQSETSVKIMNYDSDFPPGLRSDNQCISDLPSDKVPCDAIISYDSNQNANNFWAATNTSDKTCDPVETLTIPVSNLVSDLNILSQVVQGIAETNLGDSCDIRESDTAETQQKIAVTADNQVKVGDAQDESGVDSDRNEVTHL